jgi:hypothetical protein
MRWLRFLRARWDRERLDELASSIQWAVIATRIRSRLAN